MTKILLNYYSDRPFGVGYCLKFHEITGKWRKGVYLLYFSKNVLC